MGWGGYEGVGLGMEEGWQETNKLLEQYNRSDFQCVLQDKIEIHTRHIQSCMFWFASFDHLMLAPNACTKLFDFLLTLNCMYRYLKVLVCQKYISSIQN